MNENFEIVKVQRSKFIIFN